MKKSERVAIARHILDLVDRGIEADFGEESWETDVARFTDQTRFELEKQKLFREQPHLLALTGDLPEPGDFYATDIAGLPILLVRGKDGKVNAFLNACRHRGVKLAEGCGHAARFTCPYHGWTFGTDGALVGVPSRESFDEDQLKARGLIRLPVAEDVGCILVHPQPGAPLDFDAELGPMKGFLEDLDIADFRLIRAHRAPAHINWKHANDAGMEAYHVHVLHKNSFGTAGLTQLPHVQWGKHHALIAPRPDILKLKELPEEEWPHSCHFSATTRIFPNTGLGGGDPLLYFQRAEPGEKPGECDYIFRVYGRRKMLAENRAELEKWADFFMQVALVEDLPVLEDMQRQMESGVVPNVVFGKREICLTRMHRAFDRTIGYDTTPGLKQAAE
jgi:phenylpropionate dioxygenase-like ring-hydroxylating dioxygenase large terminal subunit